MAGQDGKIRAKGFDIEISDLLEKRTNDQQKSAGLDIADFFIPQLLSKTVNYKAQPKNTVELKSLNQQKLEKFRSKNHLIDILIDVFDLDLS
jgi:hypothetical protein